ncbi:type I-E CRISPR-associated protein Cas6/Cse3/CasE [Alkalilimnicola ehrlichii MLHE-1]|uniref:type I-E CRISPR-associated protein Cas6/Cse3/CasE n=1 Tax=Alkalilimnicola ehrlichii TaxID=351052 RepID=UPI000A06C07E
MAPGRGRPGRTPTGKTRLVRPDALVTGRLTVRDPDTFATLVARGVGRHRAFGFGMLLLRPA